MKQTIIFTVIALLGVCGTYAQHIQPGGFRHQGVVRDGSGRPLANMPVTLQILISEDAKMGNALYIETQELVSGPSGGFSLTVGEGNPVKGTLASVPWFQEGLWMHIFVQAKGGRRMGQVLSSSRLSAVPYAMHTLSASRIAGDPDTIGSEKQQSVFWLTSGNSLTKPGSHYLGTRDNKKLVFKTNNQTRMTISEEGQVRVRVVGAVQIGDYILPSGNNDGLGIGVHPEDMDYDDYPKVAGIAWESAADQPVNIVRVGVGLNRNDLGPKVTEISGKVDNILAYLEGKAPLQRELSPSARQISKAPALKKLMTDEAFDALLVQYANALKQHFTQIEQQIKAGGGEITDPVLAEMIRDPVAAGKIMRRDPRLESIWAHFDQLITVKQ
ncbi:MAG: hypothetical protein ACOYOO_09895 [Saprospiraceae bacterium]